MLRIISNAFRNIDSANARFGLRNSLQILSRNLSEEEAARAAAKNIPDDTQLSIFERIIRREVPADIVFEDDKCLAFNDVTPQAPTHFLVVPKTKIPTLSDCGPEHQTILSHLIMTAKTLAQQKLPGGYRLVINNGKDGAQSVYHLHIHILGGRQMKWPPG